MQYILFEDQVCENFNPLTLTRPTDDLRIGILTIRDKWLYALGLDVEESNVQRLLRDPLKGVFTANEVHADNEVVWLNSRILPTKEIAESVKALDVNCGLSHKKNESDESIIIAFKTKVSESGELKSKPNTADINFKNVDELDYLERIWDLFLNNHQQIQHDIQLMDVKGIAKSAKISKHAILENEDQIFIEEGATIEPGVILYAEEGPIYIGKNAKVMAGSILRGNVAICEKATVNMAAKIYSNTTIGPVCKVGGEISSTIFHSFSNKGHDGFVGNSIVGQWCNFGADSNTSNLKNNYSSVRFADWSSKKLVDSGRQFLGTIMGDHSKTAINTMLNTGTICGVNCNLFASGFPLKYVPSFRWVANDCTRVYEFEKAMEVAERVMARRNVSLTPEYIRMMRKIFETAVNE